MCETCVKQGRAEMRAEIGEIANVLNSAAIARAEKAEAENARLVAELQRQTVWPYEAEPFSPSQVRDLLDENERLRAVATAARAALAQYDAPHEVWTPRDGVEAAANLRAALASLDAAQP